MADALATKDDILTLLGDLNDRRVVDILATGATVADLEEVAMWLAGGSDVMGEERKSLSGRAAVIYDMVARDEEWAAEDSAHRA